MLIKTRFAIIVAALALAFSSQTFAQQNLGPAMNYPTVYGAPKAAIGMGDYPDDAFAAEWDPMDIEYDMQFFAPLDLSSYGGAPAIRNGFHAAIDMTYMSYTRPKPFNSNNSAAVPVGNDWITGRQYTLGYTNEVGNGWYADYLTTDGSFWSGGINPDPAALWTTSRLDRFGLKRVFRTKLNQGGYLEPYAGVSYLSVNDKTHQRGTFEIIDDNGTPLDPTDDVTVEVNGTLKQLAANSAVGGQIGTKFFQQHGRWNVTSNVALSGFYNNQTARVTNRGVTADVSATSQLNGSSSDFVPLVDLGIESSYAITRDISLRAGAELLYIWSGLNRVNTASTVGPTTSAVSIPSQSATLVGFTFGIEWRR